jgi:hypothetical protein
MSNRAIGRAASGVRVARAESGGRGGGGQAKNKSVLTHHEMHWQEAKSRKTITAQLCDSGLWQRRLEQTEKVCAYPSSYPFLLSLRPLSTESFANNK